MGPFSCQEFYRGGLTLAAEAVWNVWGHAERSIPSGVRLAAHFGHREHANRSIESTWIGDRERSEATPGVQASS
jgi:hypothetical protein